MARTAPPTVKDLLWLACRDKACCHATKVVVTGADLHRMATALDVAPWDPVVYTEAPPEAADGFRLAAGGPRYQLVLAKREDGGRGDAACVFLWKLADGHAQCGLGELRPLVCQSYPAVIVDGMVGADSPACTCRRWTIDDLDAGAERARLDALLAETAVYAAVVEAWNAALPDPPEVCTFTAFCRYVLAAYAARARAVVVP
jgi:Fe-S-cluster containining protein